MLAAQRIDREANHVVKPVRYRRPSAKTVLAVTRAKREVKRSLGISQVRGWTKPSRLKQKLRCLARLYSSEARVARQTAKGSMPTLLGLSSRKR